MVININQFLAGISILDLSDMPDNFPMEKYKYINVRKTLLHSAEKLIINFIFQEIPGH